MRHNEIEYQEMLKTIKEIFPKKVALTKDEVIEITGRSLASLNRDIAEGKGIPFVKSRGRVFFPITSIAEYMTHTVQTA